MSTLSTTEKKWTYQDYLHLDDDKHYEIMGGELLMVPAPDFEHQEVVGGLYFLMRKYVKENRLGQIVAAPIDVKFDEENVVQPDIVFISQERSNIIRKWGIGGSPDLVVEVLSPSSVRWDRKNKKELYERFQVKEYWIVDRAYQSIEVYSLEGEKYQLTAFATEKETVSSLVLKGFSVKVVDVIAAQNEEM